MNMPIARPQGRPAALDQPAEAAHAAPDAAADAKAAPADLVAPVTAEDVQRGMQLLKTLGRQGAEFLQKLVEPPPRRNLQDIERNYQTPDDRMMEWSPTARTYVPVLGIPVPVDVSLPVSKPMTTTEGKLLDRLNRDNGVLGVNKFDNIVEKAQDTAYRQYPPPAGGAPLPAHVQRELNRMAPQQAVDAANAWPGNDGHMDAFRHAYWNALSTKAFGAEWTRQFTTAHEGVPGNGSVREAMDLYNNEVGRKIAVANPDASEEELAVLIRKAVDNGEMVVVGADGKLAWSDKVAVGQHGIADPAPAAARQPMPAGDAKPTS